MRSPDAKAEIGVCRISGFLLWGPSVPLHGESDLVCMYTLCIRLEIVSSALNSGVYRL